MTDGFARRGLGLEEISVVVTGGASNIGRGIVLAMAGEGARVTILDIDSEQAKRTVDAAAELPGEVYVIACDVTESAQVERAVTKILADRRRINVLVNNAGWSKPAWFADVTMAEMQKAISANLMSTIYVTRAVLPSMAADGGGSVVSIASDAAFGELRSSVYGAAKGGVISLTKGLAREYGRYRIRFNVVSPGLVLPSTPEAVGEQSLWANGDQEIMSDKGRADILKSIPLRRLSTPEDIAGSVLFLASDRLSAQVTGQVISVSGGRHMP